MNELKPIRWSKCGQIQFIDGYAWGITKSLKTIPLGIEEQVEDFIKTGIMPDGLHLVQRETLREIRLDMEAEYGAGQADMVGAGNYGTVGRVKKTTSSPDKDKGLTLRQAHKKY